MKDTLQQYMEIREALRREKDQIEQRLREINTALGDTASVAGAAPATRPPGRPAGRGRGPAPKTSGAGGSGTGSGSGGGQSLRQMVLEMTSKTPMTKQEILDEVQRRGYVFESKNPANSLGVILYGKKPRFKNVGGRFSHSGGVPTTGRRRMSEEGRAKIQAAAIARWKKAKAAGKSRL